MKQLFIILFIMASAKLFGQGSVGVGTATPHTTAALDVSSTSKGMLVPRLTKLQKDAIVSPAKGLLIFQDDVDSVGFYYYDGNKWLWLEALANAGWKTSGNAGTDTSVHFIGTTDNMPLRFKINNEFMGAFNPANNNYSIGLNALVNASASTRSNIAIGNAALNAATGFSSAANIAIGDSALAKTTSSSNVGIGLSALKDNTTGNANVAIGTNVLATNTIGAQNTGVGHNLFEALKSGRRNVAIGGFTLRSDTSGSNNVAIGFGVLQLNKSRSGLVSIGSFSLAENSFGATSAIEGSRNTAIGFAALTFNHTGYSNTATGYKALFNDSSGSENTAFGDSAMYGNFSGSRNTALGFNADVGSGAINNATAIGANAQVNTSNSLVLGSIAGVNSATSSVNVGIGTSSPQRTLHVARGSAGALSPTSSIAVFESGSTGYVQLLQPSFAETGIVSGTQLTSLRSGLIFKPDSSLHFQTGGSNTRFVIDKRGLIGIGTLSPAAALHVSNGNASNQQHIAFTSVLSTFDTAYIKYDDRKLQFRSTNSAGSFWEFQDRFGNQECIIGSNGDVHMNGSMTAMRASGINVTFPLAGLHIKGFLPSSFDSHIRLESAGSADYVALVYDGDMKMRTFGASDEFQWRNAANTTTMRLTNAGALTIAGTLTQNSDARLKQNIVPIKNSLQKITGLNSYHYYWKSELLQDERLQTGLLAQEVEKEMPELVSTDGEGIKSVNYSGIIPHLIESIKELKQEIEELKKQIKN